MSGSFTLSDVAGGGATTSELLSAPTVSTYWNESFPIMTLVLTRPTSGRRIDMFRISFPRNTGVFQVDTKAVQMFLYLGIAVDSSNLSAGLHPDSAFFISTGNPPGGPPVSGAMSVNRLLLSGKGIQEMEATFNGTGPRGTDGQAVTVTGALTIRKASSTRGVGKLCALLTAC